MIGGNDGLWAWVVAVTDGGCGLVRDWVVAVWDLKNVGAFSDGGSNDRNDVVAN
jgi:hypothetical protein